MKTHQMVVHQVMVDQAVVVEEQVLTHLTQELVKLVQQILVVVEAAVEQAVLNQILVDMQEDQE